MKNAHAGSVAHSTPREIDVIASFEKASWNEPSLARSCYSRTLIAPHVAHNYCFVKPLSGLGPTASETVDSASRVICVARANLHVLSPASITILLPAQLSDSLMSYGAVM
jgi:hypothetical protein